MDSSLNMVTIQIQCQSEQQNSSIDAVIFKMGMNYNWGTFHMLIYLILTIMPSGRFYDYLHFTDEETSPVTRSSINVLFLSTITFTMRCSTEKQTSLGLALCGCITQIFF